MPLFFGIFNPIQHVVNTWMSNYRGPGTNLMLLLYRNHSNMVEPDLHTRWSKQATQQAVRAEERLPRLQRNLWSFSQTYALSIRWRYWLVFEIALQPVARSRDSATMLHPATEDVLLCCEVKCRKVCAGAPHSWCKTCVSEGRLTIVRSKTACIAMIISVIGLIVSMYATSVL